MNLNALKQKYQPIFMTGIFKVNAIQGQCIPSTVAPQQSCGPLRLTIQSYL
jgi:hypothetical protein